jgi:predicted kinase
MDDHPVLHVLCGKLASGKTTLAREIAAAGEALMVSEDLWLARLFPGEITSFEDYLGRSARLRGVLAGHVPELLRAGVSVVFDFAGNTRRERAWASSLCANGAGECVLHYLDASDALCKRRLKRRNRERPAGSRVTTEAEFDAITRYFEPPSHSEGLRIRAYDAAHRPRHNTNTIRGDLTDV